MFGWIFLRESEIALQTQLTETRVSALQAELLASKEYVAKCEHLIEHERDRVTREQERADRIADSLFQSSGLPATSATVLAEQRQSTDHQRERHLKELLEIYGDMENDLGEDGVEPLPQVLAETVKQ